MELLQNQTANVLATVVISGLSYFLFHESGGLETTGMAAIILNWLPLIIGLFTLVVYFVVRLFSEKYAWIVTLLGGAFNLTVTVKAMMDTM